MSLSSCHSKPVQLSVLHGTQKNIFCRTLILFIFQEYSDGFVKLQKRQKSFRLWINSLTFIRFSTCSKQGRRQGGAFAGRAPQTSYCAPPPPTHTFHPLPSLLNVIDLESETDKTVHIRTRLHALASVSNCTQSQIARLPPPPHRHTHTHNVICAPPRNSNAHPMEVPWRRLWL